VINEAIDSFAKRVVRAKNEFTRKHAPGPIHAQVLTGSGAMIPLIREALVRAMKAKAGTRVYDLLDDNEPQQALLPKRGPHGWYHDQQEVELRLRENQELVRGASALGGCSVFYE